MLIIVQYKPYVICDLVGKSINRQVSIAKHIINIININNFKYQGEKYTVVSDREVQKDGSLNNNKKSNE